MYPQHDQRVSLLTLRSQYIVMLTIELTHVGCYISLVGVKGVVVSLGYWTQQIIIYLLLKMYNCTFIRKIFVDTCKKMSAPKIIPVKLISMPCSVSYVHILLLGTK